MKKIVISLLSCIMVFSFSLQTFSLGTNTHEETYHTVAFVGKTTPYLLNDPQYVAVSDGKIFITSSNDSKIHIFDEKTEAYLYSIGGLSGTENGQFRSPSGIAVSNGKIYIADSLNNRIQVYSTTAKFYDFITTFGSFGNENNEFENPIEVQVSNGKIFVVDNGNKRIQAFDETTRKYVATYGGPLNLEHPRDVAIANGKVYVTDVRKNCIQVFNENTSALEATIGSSGTNDGQFSSIQGISIHGGKIYAVDNMQKRIQVFDEKTKSYLTSYKTSETSDSPFDHIYDIEIANDKIYVPDNSSLSVHTLNVADGSYNQSILDPYRDLGNIYRPTGLIIENGLIYEAQSELHQINIFNLKTNSFIERFTPNEVSYIDHFDVANDKIYITDSSVNKVFVYDAKTKKLISQFGKTGSGNGDFNYPTGITVENGKIYVFEYNNQRIQVFDEANNAYLATLNNGDMKVREFMDVYDLKVKNGYIYAVDCENNKVHMYSESTRAYVSSFGVDGLARGEMQAPVSIDIENGKIYISNSYSNNILIYDEVTKKFITTFGHTGHTGDDLEFSNNIAARIVDGYIYIADLYQSRITVVRSGSDLMKLSNQNITIHGQPFLGSVKPSTTLTITLQAIQNVNPQYRDIRWIPESFSINPSGAFTTSDGINYTAQFTLDKPNDYTLEVKWTQEIRDIGVEEAPHWHPVDPADVAYHYSTLPIKVAIEENPAVTEETPVMEENPKTGNDLPIFMFITSLLAAFIVIKSYKKFEA